ncbi:hypothetical protein LWC34_24000 [Kibdelosporangium philippinense]|uniref:Uncharacterized protein n=1 Tax=Kibdelosporangium philippinense TaxID=211113 RepID=A0ABS8ZHA1_9PSEU|nr:hypothetical protein [Kibdelosporangium philippinense]MCE7005868.1 hypothetical protein [Kibdelosporangium philippinense]
MSVRQEIRTWNRPLLVLAGLALVQLVLSVGGLLFDDRVLIGDPIWLKPFKFAVSIAVYAATLAWMVSLLHKGKRVAWWMAMITTVAMVIEMIALVLQTVRGVPSHFNAAPGFDSMVFSIMGNAIVVLWVANLVVAILLMRQRVLDAPMAWAIRLGVVLALIGMAVAFFMTPPTPEQMALLRQDIDPAMIGGHSVGVVDGGPGMPITGWSTVGGDLRIPHFFGIHAMQTLPLLALFLRRRFESVEIRTRLVLIGGIFYAGVLGLVLWQALRGQSLIAPDSLTLGVLGVLVVGSAGAWATAVRSKVSKSKALV